MIRNSIHTFEDTSKSISKVPLKGIIQVEGTDIFMQLLTKAGSTTIQDLIDQLPVGNAGTYIDIVENDKAGKNFDASEAYEIGDITTKDGAPYICLSDIAPKPFDPTDWTLLSDVVEYRGRNWDNTKAYLIGDIVTLSNSIFIATHNNTGSNPSNGHNWLHTETIRYNEGVWNPTTGTGGTTPDAQYPDASVLTKAGAIFYIKGAGDYGVAGSGYTFTSGPLSGVLVYNNDKIVWQGTDGSNKDIWLHESFPRVKGEVGGVHWSSTVSYEIGDIVTDFNANETFIYYCNTAQAAGEPLPSANTNWTKLDEQMILTDGNNQDDILEWDATASKWVVKPAPTFVNLPDTAPVMGANGQKAVVLAGKVGFEDDKIHSIDDTPNTSVDLDLLHWDAASTSWTNIQPSALADEISFGDLKDIPTPSGGNDGASVVYNSTTSNFVYETPRRTFIELDDTTPTNYTGSGDYKVVVNSTATGIEFQDDTLGNINDVDVASLADQAVLQYDLANTKWVSNSPSTLATNIALGDLKDVNLTAPVADGHTIIWNDANSKWVNVLNSLGSLSDVDLTSHIPTTGDALYWDGNNWIPMTSISGTSIEYDGPTDPDGPVNGTNGTFLLDHAIGKIDVYVNGIMLSSLRAEYSETVNGVTITTPPSVGSWVKLVTR